MPAMSTRIHLFTSWFNLLSFLGAGLVVGPVVTEVVGQERQRLTVERVASLPSLIGTAPSSPVWSPDSTRLAFLWNDMALPFRDVWVVAVTDGTLERWTAMSEAFPSPPLEASGLTDALGDQAKTPSQSGVSELIWAPDGQAVVFSYQGALFRTKGNVKSVERLTQSRVGKSHLVFSPKGRFLSFLEGGDLWLWNQDTNQRLRATRLGKPTIGSVPGGAFFQPEVEFRSFKWSPDGLFVALDFVDRQNIRKVPFPYYLGEETSMNVLRRGYPGDSDELRAVAIYSIEEGTIRFIELPQATSRGILDYSWSPDSSQLLIDQDSDVAVDRWLYVVSSEDLTFRELWHDQGERRGYPVFSSFWRADGSGVLFVGDLDERYRLYSMSLNDDAPTRLTGGTWDVVGSRGRSTVTLVPQTRELFFVSNRKNAYERQVYRMPERGGPVMQVTSLPGVHIPFVSPDGLTVAVLHSNDVTPTELYIVDAKGGTAEKRITRSPPDEFYNYEFVEPRYVTFKSRIDDFVLHGRILEPPDLDQSQKYPVVLGPVYSNTVRNEWRGLYSTLQQFMALERGYINLQIDIRGSVGYGKAFREVFQGDWGGGDIEDLHSGVEYLGTLPYVDSARIGIWGSSYGGTLTVFSLFKKPGLYQAGVAGAPAVDVAHFTLYDMHLSRRPSTHPEIFKEASALNYGENLVDPLFIIHGMQDDIVPFRTSVLLAEKLIRLGKDFDFAFAPTSSHGWSRQEHYAVFFFRKLVAFFDRHVGAGPQAKGSSHD